MKQGDEAGIGRTVAELEQRLAAGIAERDELLRQQAASAEILKVINASQGDLKPVFDVILEKAHSLCDVPCGSLQLYDGDHTRAVAVRGMNDAFETFLRQGYRVTNQIHGAQAEHPVQLDDLTNALARVPDDSGLRAAIELGGMRTILSVPLVKDGVAFGRIVAGRQEVRRFSDKQIALLQGFAEQAVIAIENARLFNETKEALEQQTATADILKVIASSPDDVQPVFQAIAERSNRLVNGLSTTVLSIAGDAVTLSAFTRTNPAADAALAASFPRKLSEQPFGKSIINGEIYRIPDTENEPLLRDLGRLRGYRSMLFVPLLREGMPIGMIGQTRAEPGPFAESHVRLLQTFADQAGIAIQNARLFNETKEALEQQTATGEILTSISGAMTDAKPVFDTIVRNTLRLFGTRFAAIQILNDGMVEMPVANGEPGFERLAERFPRPLDDSFIGGQSMLSKRVVQVSATNDPGAPPTTQQFGRDFGFESVIAAPMIRGDKVVGVIVTAHGETKAFDQKQTALISAFADQAAIAIENARLFKEVQDRTRDLSESLQQQTATADVLKVISRSTFDLQTVLETLIKSAVELSGANRGSIFLREGEVFPLKAASDTTPGFLQYWAANPPRAGRGSATHRVIASGKVEMIPDVLQDAEMQMPAGALARIRATLGVPMLRDDKVEGVLVLTRPEPGVFSKSQIDLVQTFADQAVIAVENVRLFDETQARTRELATSLDDLRAAQDRLVQTEKLASLGQLTAGIAHEIKNPLNFVNNFSALSAELIDELDEVLAPAGLDQKTRGEVAELTAMLKSNLEKVVQHGKRADSIVKNMLLHSREGSGEHRASDINAIVDESLNLAYHGARAERPGFNITLRREFDPDAGAVELFPQEISRVLLNLISNGFYAATKRKEAGDETYEPELSASTKSLGNAVQIRIRDNGTGIPLDVKEKMFNPFFTTKPAGEGTGLGLSMSHDIVVKQHGGTIDVETAPGAFTEFVITLPRNGAAKTITGGRN